MKRFMCIPLAICLPIIFLLISLLLAGVFCYVGYRVGWQNATDIIAVGAFLVIMSVGIALFTLRMGTRRIELYEDRVVCKGVLPKDTFEITYETSSVGMDWHQQSGSTVWWICIYQGRFPPYKGKGVSSRVNSIKIQPGFIRIMYSEEVYNAFLEVLPKKQKTALVTARRTAGLD